MNISATLSEYLLWMKVIGGETSVQFWMPLLKKDTVKLEKLQKHTTETVISVAIILSNHFKTNN